MVAQSNAAPVIIKRKKVVGGDAHHGGAWKVAYADFVTAMMAFFMLMWLLNATTEKQRKGLADYFSPTVPLSRISGGGEGAFAGSSVFSQDTLQFDGTGATDERATDAMLAKGETGVDPEDLETALGEDLQSLQEELKGKAGESMVSEDFARHIVTRVTNEGLIIELFEVENVNFFEPDTDTPTRFFRELTKVVSRVTARVKNDLSIGAHVRSRPIVLIHNPSWDLSTARAHATRALLEKAGTRKSRIRRVAGHADRTLADRDPMAVRNNRVEITLFRK